MIEVVLASCLGFLAGCVWMSALTSRTRPDAGLLEIKNLAIEAEAASKAALEETERLRRSIDDDIKAMQEFSALWNYGARDEAHAVLTDRGIPVVIKED